MKIPIHFTLCKWSDRPHVGSKMAIPTSVPVVWYDLWQTLCPMQRAHQAQQIMLPDCSGKGKTIMTYNNSQNNGVINLGFSTQSRPWSTWLKSSYAANIQLYLILHSIANLTRTTVLPRRQCLRHTGPAELFQCPHCCRACFPIHLLVTHLHQATLVRRCLPDMPTSMINTSMSKVLSFSTMLFCTHQPHGGPGVFCLPERYGLSMESATILDKFPVIVRRSIFLGNRCNSCSKSGRWGFLPD